jgi:hypothetical protein
MVDTNDLEVKPQPPVEYVEDYRKAITDSLTAVSEKINDANSRLDTEGEVFWNYAEAAIPDAKYAWADEELLSKALNILGSILGEIAIQTRWVVLLQNSCGLNIAEVYQPIIEPGTEPHNLTRPGYPDNLVKTYSGVDPFRVTLMAINHVFDRIVKDGVY